MVGEYGKEINFTQFNQNLFIALNCLANSDKPVGSWILKERMEELGVNISLATVGRLLKEMDRLELTEKRNSLGRILTEAGVLELERMKQLMERQQIEHEVKEATDAENPQDIIDLLKARLLIEPEIIKQIVSHASIENIQLLKDAVCEHDKYLREKIEVSTLPINFHSIVSDLSCNRFLGAMLKLLIHEELKLEEKFPEIAQKLRQAHHLDEHKLILDAILNRDTEKAVYYSKMHIQELIECIRV
ncbi:GntR family transcriptional regulator [Lysinibacillus sp. PLM2]|nr:GntR family transcriptional regulator [Lysinibacillus sp. PLM2]